MTVNISVDLPTQRRIRAGAKFLLEIADIMGEEDPNEPVFAATRDLRAERDTTETAPPAPTAPLIGLEVLPEPTPEGNPGAAMLMCGVTLPASPTVATVTNGGAAPVSIVGAGAPITLAPGESVPVPSPAAASLLAAPGPTSPPVDVAGSPLSGGTMLAPANNDFVVLHPDGSERAGFKSSADFVHVLKVEISETNSRDALAKLSEVHTKVYDRLDRGEKSSVTRAFNARRDELLAMERSGTAPAAAATHAADGSLLPWVGQQPAEAPAPDLMSASAQLLGGAATLAPAPLLQAPADPLAAPAVDPLAAPVQETRPQLSYEDFEAQFRPQALVAGVQVFRAIFAECCPAGAPPGINTISPDKYWRAIDMVKEAMAKNGK